MSVRMSRRAFLATMASVLVAGDALAQEPVPPAPDAGADDADAAPDDVERVDTASEDTTTEPAVPARALWLAGGPEAAAARSPFAPPTITSW